MTPESRLVWRILGGRLLVKRLEEAEEVFYSVIKYDIIMLIIFMNFKKITGSFIY
jgi:hypothetical protein